MMAKWSGRNVRSIFMLPKGFVFVGGGAADVADPCQFTDVQLPVLMGRIVAEKHGVDVLFTHLRPLDLSALGSGALRATARSYANHCQAQFLVFLHL